MNLWARPRWAAHSTGAASGINTLVTSGTNEPARSPRDFRARREILPNNDDNVFKWLTYAERQPRRPEDRGRPRSSGKSSLYNIIIISLLRAHRRGWSSTPTPPHHHHLTTVPARNPHPFPSCPSPATPCPPVVVPLAPRGIPSKGRHGKLCGY